jgi:glucose-6-phosphate 1-dehydrogenase
MFIGYKELDAAWKLTDKISSSIKNIEPKLYESGSDGPKLMD